ncbi:MAG: S46 family peptidase [Rhodanobacteraceae bacterium]
MNDTQEITLKISSAFFLGLCLTLAAATPAFADEGMWTLNNLPGKQLQDKYHFTPTQAWIDHVEHSALRIAGGCTASFVSADGLVMTNHHCANGCLVANSTPKQNYMETGFMAADRKGELKCPDMELNQLESITDVTGKVNAATHGKTGAAFIKAQRAVIGNIEQQCAGNNAVTRRCQVVTLYHGGRYDLYTYRRYQDVRLAFAPEQEIAFFGGDLDNFNFPRYDLDVTFLRAYVDGKPAHTGYFRFDPQGPKDGDLTFVVGNPGSTQRNYTIAQLKSLRNDDLIPLLAYLSELRGMLWEYGQQNAEQARQAAEPIFGIDNALKAFKGRIQALDNPALYAEKEKSEAALRQWVNATPARRAEYGNPWTTIANAEKQYANLATRYRMLERGQGFNGDLFSIARTLVRAAEERAKPNAERLSRYRDSNLPAVEQSVFSSAPIHPKLETTEMTWSLHKLRQALGADNPLVHQIFGKQDPAELAKQLVGGTRLMSVADRKQLWRGGLKAIKASTDPMIRFALEVDPASRAVRKQYEDEVEAPIRTAGEALAKARFAKYGTSIYPDATFTLRLSYGQVKGWMEKGRMVKPFTDFAGVYTRATGSEPFRLPESWIKAKDQLNLATHFDFVTTNDIIGGNSGSPVIDRAGDVVGLIFDGNIHSLGGGYWYNGSTNRAVAVDTAALLEAIRNVYHDKALAHELENGHT